jgi:hypothetical protein
MYTSPTSGINKALREQLTALPGTRFEEQRQLHLPQKHKATVPDSTLRNEWAGGASRQCPGPRPLLEAPLMARGHQAHIRQRWLKIYYI